jgi:TatD DNase family protein
VRLVDSHAHLQAPAFSADAAAVLEAARDGGVERLMAPGYDPASSRASVALARTHGTDASVGVHPHVAADVTGAEWRALVDLARHPAVVAVGETGLDYDRGLSPRAVQRTNLERHLDLAFALAKPVILHCRSAPGERDAQDDLLATLEAAGVGDAAWRDRFAARPAAILHSFSGPVDYGERALALGLALSFSGLCFRRGEEASAEVARLVPAERLLTETDSPYLSPPGAPRRRNEPRWVEVTARWLADRRGVSLDDLGAGLVAAYDAVLSRARNDSSPSAPWSR